MNNTHLVFIYGTLKKGFHFHDAYLGGDKSKPLGKALAGLGFSLYVDGMPHLVAEKTDKPVKGELYEVSEEVLKTLDNLEGHPVTYRREVIDVTDAEGNEILAWAYIRPNQFRGRKMAWKEEEFL